MIRSRRVVPAGKEPSTSSPTKNMTTEPSISSSPRVSPRKKPAEIKEEDEVEFVVGTNHELVLEQVTPTPRKRGRPKGSTKAVAQVIATPRKEVPAPIDLTPNIVDRPRRSIKPPRQLSPEVPGAYVSVDSNDDEDDQEYIEVKVEVATDDDEVVEEEKAKKKQVKRVKKQHKSTTIEGIVKMDDIEEDDDPMKRVERRGRKRKSDPGFTPVKLPKKVPKVRKIDLTGDDDEGENSPVKKMIRNTSSATKAPLAEAEGAAAAGEAADAVEEAVEVVVEGDEQGHDDDEEDGVVREIQLEKAENGEQENEEELEEEDATVDVETYEGDKTDKTGRWPYRIVNRHLPFKCGECGISYRREAYLLNHLANVHKDECAILTAAERRARQAAARPRHIVPKHRPGEAAYKFGCDLCDRRFLRWEGLITHQKQIHREVTEAANELKAKRDYGVKCPVCELFFYGNHALSQHVAKDHPDHDRFIFACDICGMGFMHWARVRAHKTQVHQVPVKYRQGYVKRNPELARTVEAERMRKAVERNRAKRMLERGQLTLEQGQRVGLTQEEMEQYSYLMPPTLDPEEGAAHQQGEEEDAAYEEVVEEEGIVDPNDVLNVDMIPRHRLHSSMSSYTQHHQQRQQHLPYHQDHLQYHRRPAIIRDPAVRQLLQRHRQHQRQQQELLARERPLSRMMPARLMSYHLPMSGGRQMRMKQHDQSIKDEEMDDEGGMVVAHEEIIDDDDFLEVDVEGEHHPMDDDDDAGVVMEGDEVVDEELGVVHVEEVEEDVDVDGSDLGEMNEGSGGVVVVEGEEGIEGAESRGVVIEEMKEGEELQEEEEEDESDCPTEMPQLEAEY